MEYVLKMRTHIIRADSSVYMCIASVADNSQKILLYVRDKLGSERRRAQYQCVEAGTSEESTRLTLAGLDGARNKVQASLMRGPERALCIPLSEGRG